MPTKSLSIVIPTREKCRSLKRTLASLEKIAAARSKCEVIVVDDDSHDETERWLADYRPAFPLHRLRNNQAAGPATARNRGSREAQGDILLFLDDDMECAPDLVEAHLAHHETNADVAVIGRAIYHPELKHNALMRYFDVQHRRHASPLCPPVRFSTNNLSLSRSLFERVGRFDASFSCVGLEDVELGMRLARIPGCALRYEPRAFAYHYHDQSLSDYMRKVESAGQKNLPILAAKYPSEIAAGAVGRLVSGPTDGLAERGLRVLLSLPFAAPVLIPVAEAARAEWLNRLLVKYLLASAMLTGYRRSQRAPGRAAAAVPGITDDFNVAVDVDRQTGARKEAWAASARLDQQERRA